MPQDVGGKAVQCSFASVADLILLSPTEPFRLMSSGVPSQPDPEGKLSSSSKSNIHFEVAGVVFMPVPLYVS